MGDVLRRQPYDDRRGYAACQDRDGHEEELPPPQPAEEGRVVEGIEVPGPSRAESEPAVTPGARSVRRPRRVPMRIVDAPTCPGSPRHPSLRAGQPVPALIALVPLS